MEPIHAAPETIISVGDDTLVIRSEPLDIAQPLFYSFAANEGWNPGLNDPFLFGQCDDQGFHVLYLIEKERHERTVVSILCTLAIDNRGFIGPWVTHPQFRSKGFGSLLFNHGMERLKAMKLSRIGLDSTIKQQPYYSRCWGFHHSVERECRFAGIVDLAVKYDDQENDRVQIASVLDAKVAHLPVAIQRLFEECSATGISSARFVSAWLDQKEDSSVSLVAFFDDDVAEPNASLSLAGFITARRAGNGFRVAPLFATSQSLARRLLIAVQERVGAIEVLNIDVPESHLSSLSLMKELDLDLIFQSVRCFTAPLLESDEHDATILRSRHLVYGSEAAP